MGDTARAILGLVQGAAKAVYSTAELDEKSAIRDSAATKRQSFLTAQNRERAQNELKFIERRRVNAMEKLKAAGKQTTTENIRKEGVAGKAASVSNKAKVLAASVKHQRGLVSEAAKAKVLPVYTDGQRTGSRLASMDSQAVVDKNAGKPKPKTEVQARTEAQAIADELDPIGPNALRPDAMKEAYGGLTKEEWVQRKTQEILGGGKKQGVVQGATKPGKTEKKTVPKVDLETRGLELRDQGLTDPEIVKQLRKEGYG